MSYVIKQQGLKGGNLPRSGLLEPCHAPDRGKRQPLPVMAKFARKCIKNNKVSEMTIASIITWGITLLGLVAAGVFAITKYMNSNAIRALEDRVRLKDDKIREYEQKLSTGELFAQKYLPAHAVAAGLNDSNIESLVTKIEELEKQKEQLLLEVSTKAASSLDPRSELSTLLAQLESDDEAVRAKAIDGLFTLRDPLSFLPLVKYLENRPDEATGGRNPYIGKWFSLFIEAGGIAGVEFVAAQLENPQGIWSESSFSTLNYELDTVQLIEDAIPVLENIALRSSSSLARTKAKVLIQSLQIKSHEVAEMDQRKKEHEQEMEELGATGSRGYKIPHEFIILTTLNRNGLGHVAADMVARGHDFKYWITGICVTQEFLKEPSHQDNCVAAIQDLIEAKTQIAPSSLCMLLFLLSKMELFRGNSIAADGHLQSCKETAPETYEYLIDNGDAYDLIKLQGVLLKTQEDKK